MIINQHLLNQQTIKLQKIKHLQPLPPCSKQTPLLIHSWIVAAGGVKEDFDSFSLIILQPSCLTQRSTVFETKLCFCSRMLTLCYPYCILQFCLVFVCLFVKITFYQQTLFGDKN